MFELDRRIETLDENLNKTIKMLTMDPLLGPEEALESLEETILEQPRDLEEAANDSYTAKTSW